jgi:hypothetical protein
MGLSEDGTNNETCHHSNTELAEFGPFDQETRPEIYVSIFNPVGEPAFKPSKTKPLPKWMQLLPNNVHREREEQRRKANACEEGSHSHELEFWKALTQNLILILANLSVIIWKGHRKTRHLDSREREYALLPFRLISQDSQDSEQLYPSIQEPK